MSRHHHSPFVRRVLADRGLTPEQVRATGPGGRITRRDLLAHLANAPTANGSATYAEPSMMVAEVDYHLVERARGAARSTGRPGNVAEPTHLPFVLRAVVDALPAHPELAAATEMGAHPRPTGGIHLAVAGAGENVRATVLRDAQDLRLLAIARHLERRAAGHPVGPADDRTKFLIVDTARLGVFISGVAVVAPQVAVLTVGSVAPRPVAVPVAEGGHGLGVRPVGTLVLAVDPHVIEARRAASFLNAVKTTLETRDWMTEM